MSKFCATPPPPSVSDEQVRALLVRYQCPVPFHEVRTRFLGNIATPIMSASPMRIMQGLWGGELPPFESMEAMNEFIAALVMGLWNRLTRHQDRNFPFRLTRVETPVTQEGLAALALMRVQEIEGFICGLFDNNDEIDLPERARRALDELGKMRALFEAAHKLAMGGAKDATLINIKQTLKRLREMTKSAEHAMQKVVLSCKQARGHMLSGFTVKEPTIH